METEIVNVIRDLATEVARNRGASWFPPEVNNEVAALMADTTTPGDQRLRQLLDIIEEHTTKTHIINWLRARAA